MAGLPAVRKHLLLKWFNFASFKGICGCTLDLCNPGLAAIRYAVLFSTQTVTEVSKSCCSISVILTKITCCLTLLKIVMKQCVCSINIVWESYN